jgi:hypothetical protein
MDAKCRPRTDFGRMKVARRDHVRRSAARWHPGNRRPAFEPAASAGLPSAEPLIALEIGGDARAYPRVSCCGTKSTTSWAESRSS